MSSKGVFISLISPHLIWPNLSWPHFIWTENSVIGRSGGELGRFTSHEPVRRRYTTYHSTPGSDEMRSGRMRWSEMSYIRTLRDCWVRVHAVLLMSWRRLSHDPHYHHLDLVVQQQQQQPPHPVPLSYCQAISCMGLDAAVNGSYIALHLTSSTTSDDVCATRNSLPRSGPSCTQLVRPSSSRSRRDCLSSDADSVCQRTHRWTDIRCGIQL